VLANEFAQPVQDERWPGAMAQQALTSGNRPRRTNARSRRRRTRASARARASTPAAAVKTTPAAATNNIAGCAGLGQDVSHDVSHDATRSSCRPVTDQEFAGDFMRLEEVVAAPFHFERRDASTFGVVLDS
jgi:hypothetical protein